MPDTMIERMARALSQVQTGSEENWPTCVKEVRAVLAAMRDLPKDLRDKACQSDNVIAWGDYGEFWSAAIDVALAEEKNDA